MRKTTLFTTNVLVASLLMLSVVNVMATENNPDNKNYCNVYYSEKMDKLYKAGTIMVDGIVQKFTSLNCSKDGYPSVVVPATAKFVGKAPYSNMINHIGGAPYIR